MYIFLFFSFLFFSLTSEIARAETAQSITEQYDLVPCSSCLLDDDFTKAAIAYRQQHDGDKILAVYNTEAGLIRAVRVSKRTADIVSPYGTGLQVFYLGVIVATPDDLAIAFDKHLEWYQSLPSEKKGQPVEYEYDANNFDVAGDPWTFTTLIEHPLNAYFNKVTKDLFYLTKFGSIMKVTSRDGYTLYYFQSPGSSSDIEWLLLFYVDPKGNVHFGSQKDVQEAINAMRTRGIYSVGFPGIRARGHMLLEGGGIDCDGTKCEIIITRG